MKLHLGGVGPVRTARAPTSVPEEIAKCILCWWWTVYPERLLIYHAGTGSELSCSVSLMKLATD